MNKNLSCCGVLAAFSLTCVTGVANADEDVFEGCPKVFADKSYGSDWFRDNCTDELARQRAELTAWGIDNNRMSDVQAWDRHAAEAAVRADARAKQERQDRLEGERLAAERAKERTEQDRIAAQRSREAEQYGAEQMKAGQQMMQEQNQMLQGLGVNLGSTSVKHEDCEDDDYYADELNMYQAMVDNGIAPQCNGMTCAEFVDCVDAVLDAEEE